MSTQAPPLPPPQPTFTRANPPVGGIGREVDLSLLVPLGRFSGPDNGCKVCAGLSGVHTCCLKCRNFYEADRPLIPLKSIQQTLLDWVRTGCTFSRDGATKSVTQDDWVYLLAQTLTARLSTNTDKARAIFTWISRNIRFSLKHRYCLAAKQVLDSGRGVCNGFSVLFVDLAKAAGLNAKTVPGRSKTWQFNGNLYGGAEMDFKHADHAWIAVQLESGWKLMDPTWGADGEIGQNDEAVINYCYFSVSNDDFAIRHFPAQYNKDGTKNTEERFYADPVPGATGAVKNIPYPLWSAEDVPPPMLLNTHILDITSESLVVPKRGLLRLPTNDAPTTFSFGLACTHQNLSAFTFFVRIWRDETAEEVKKRIAATAATPAPAQPPAQGPSNLSPAAPAPSSTAPQRVPALLLLTRTENRFATPRALRRDELYFEENPNQDPFDTFAVYLLTNVGYEQRRLHAKIIEWRVQ